MQSSYSSCPFSLKKSTNPSFVIFILNFRTLSLSLLLPLCSSPSRTSRCRLYTSSSVTITDSSFRSLHLACPYSTATLTTLVPRKSMLSLAEDHLSNRTLLWKLPQHFLRNINMHCPCETTSILYQILLQDPPQRWSRLRPARWPWYCTFASRVTFLTQLFPFSHCDLFYDPTYWFFLTFILAPKELSDSHHRINLDNIVIDFPLMTFMWIKKKIVVHHCSVEHQ